MEKLAVVIRLVKRVYHRTLTAPITRALRNDLLLREIHSCFLQVLSAKYLVHVNNSPNNNTFLETCIPLKWIKTSGSTKDIFTFQSVHVFIGFCSNQSIQYMTMRMTTWKWGWSGTVTLTFCVAQILFSTYLRTTFKQFYYQGLWVFSADAHIQWKCICLCAHSFKNEHHGKKSLVFIGDICFFVDPFPIKTVATVIQSNKDCDVGRRF